MTGKGKMRRGRLILAAACLLLGIAMPVKASEEPGDSGQCGADITWKYESVTVNGYEEYMLVLTGSGAMTNEYLKRVDFVEGGTWHWETEPPWNIAELYGIRLDDRITTIGDGAFGNIMLFDPNQAGSTGEADGTLVLPKNLTSIGRLAFTNAKLGAIYIGSQVTKVGEEAFSFCEMEDLFVASKTLDFGKEPRVLYDCTLKTIHAPKGSKAEAYAKAHNIGYEEWDGTDYGKTSYTVTLDAGDGAFPQTAQSSRYTVSADRKTAVREVSIGAVSVPVPDIAPALEGKYFGGWYLGNAPFAFETTALKQDTTLTAKWLDTPTAPVLTICNESEYWVTLSWELRMDANLKGYRVYRESTAGAGFVKLTDLSADRDAYTDSVNQGDVLKKQTYCYYIEAVYETDGVENPVTSNQVSCNGMIYNADLIEQTGGLYVGARLLNAEGQEIPSLTIHEGETSEELFLALVKKDGTTVFWQDASKDFPERASVDWGIGLPYPARYPVGDASEDMEPYEYVKFPIGYLNDSRCTRLKGLKITGGQQLYLYVAGQPGFMMAIPVTVEAAEPGVTYPSYDDKEGNVTDNLQAGLQVLRDAVRNRESYKEVYIKKSACDPSIAAYNELRSQDESNNPSGSGQGGLIPEWVEAELYDVNKERAGMKPWEGDYAYYAILVGGTNADLEYPVKIYGEEYYKLTMNASKYGTTVQQEEAVDAKVAELLNGRFAGMKGQSEYARAKALYNFVSTSIQWNNSDPVYYYAYGGLCKGKATCMGSALVFQRLAAELGLESKVIMGLDSAAHAYNLVKIQGKYYFLDCTVKDPKRGFLKGSRNFYHALLQDRYLSTAFQTYYMANISENDYVGGQDSTLGKTALRALTDEEINAVSEGAYTGIADRTKAKYAVKGTVIQATPFDKAHPLKPVYEANSDAQNYVLAFRMTIDKEKLQDSGTVKFFAGKGESEGFTKANSTLKDGYLDVLCPIDEGVSIVIDYDTADESASRYEAVTYTMDFSKLVKAPVRASGTAQERTDAVAETGIELSSPFISYRNGDKEVTVVYDAVAYSSAINKENTGLAETAGNYAALRISAPEAMLGTKALGNTTAAFSQESSDGSGNSPQSDGCVMKWGPNQTYLDCFCKMEKGKDKSLTIIWAGKDMQTQNITLRASQDCYMETDGAGKDAAKKVAFNGFPATLYVGQSQIADVKVTRAYEKDEVQLSFTSDDSNILSVNRVTGEVKALRPGKATLTVRAAGLDRKGKVVSASKKITVKQVPAPAGVKITEIKDVSVAATWKKNSNSRWTEGYAVPYTSGLGSNAKAWKAAVEKALAEAGLDNGMPESMTDEQRQALENKLSDALCPGAEGKVVSARAQVTEGRLIWESGLRPNTSYVFYLRNMTENAAGEISYAGWMSGKLKTKLPVLTKIQLTAYDANGSEAAFNDQENSGYSYTDPTNDRIPARVRYELSAADSWQNDKDIFKSPSYKSTNAKVVKVNNKGMLSLGGQAGIAEIYVTGKDTSGAVRESNRIKIRVVKSLRTIKNKTTALVLGQSVSLQELVGCDVKGSADAFALEKVDLAAMADELEQNGKDCFTVVYPAGEKEKAVITPFAYPVDEKSGERKKGASLTISVKLYDKAGEGRQLLDTKNAVIKVNDMPAPAINKATALDTSVEIIFKPSAVVREMDGAQYYYTLTLTNQSTGEEKTYKAQAAESGSGLSQQNPAEETTQTFAYEPVLDKKGQLSAYRCTINGLAAATGYEVVVTANYLPTAQEQQGVLSNTPVQKASGKKKFTTLKPVLAAENSMKISLVSMEELWADTDAAGQEITHDTVVELKNGKTYVMFADIGDYDRVLGADRIKWSVTSDPKGAAAVKTSSDSYAANLTLSRCGTVRVQAVSTLSKKVVCSFTVEVKPYQYEHSSTQAGGNENEN